MLRGIDAPFTQRARHVFRLGALALGFAASSAWAQESANWTVTTLAGSATQTGAVNGVGAGALFNEPRGIAIDRNGTLYVADTQNNTIRTISPNGTVATLAGDPTQIGFKDGSGASALFNQPTGLALDASGTVLYVADSQNDVIRAINTGTGGVTTFAGTPMTPGASDDVGANATFNQPVGVTVDTSGNVYVADSGNSEIRKITSDGSTVSTLLPTVGSPQFNSPYGIAVDVHGKLYIADTFNNVICTMTSDGTVTVVAGSATNLHGSVDGTGPAASFFAPSAITLNPGGTMLVSESGNSEIRAIDAGTAVVTTLAGTSAQTGANDGAGSVATFSAPQGVACATDGTIYICDTLNSTIRKLVHGTPVQDPSPRFSNISTRSFVSTGDNVLIGGFIIGGTTSKKILIRASGPALIPQGVPSASVLTDPMLDIYQGSTVIASNDDWGADPVNQTNVAQANQTTGANWPTTSKDAAVVMTLAPGPYTAIVSGKNNGQGIALVEVFEIGNDGSSRLVNISTRSRVQTGDGVQIAGFIISGTTSKKVLVRAGGPFLSPYFSDKSAVLSDPIIQLYQGSSQIASNDDWSADPTQATTIQQAVSAAGAVPYTQGSKDAALVMTLAPGAYTAIVSGKNNAQGIALIEVDEVP